MPERWKKLIIKHEQEKIKNHYWEHDELFEVMMERFIIWVGDDSSLEDSSSAEDPSSGEVSSSSEDTSMEAWVAIWSFSFFS